MVLNCVTPSLSLSHNQQQESGAPKKDDVKGIKPRDELEEHLAFYLKDFFDYKNVCQEQIVYNVDCRTASRVNQSDVNPNQLTTGCGGGYRTLVRKIHKDIIPRKLTTGCGGG